jgi:hypothetical protein
MIDFSFQSSFIPEEEKFNWMTDNQITIYDGRKDTWKKLVTCRNKFALTQTKSKDVFILENSSDKFFSIMLHEVGHIFLGDYHSDHMEDIMYPVYTGKQTLSLRDQSKVCLRVGTILFPQYPEKLMDCYVELIKK